MPSDFKAIKQISPDDFANGLFQFGSDKYQVNIMLFLEDNECMSMAVCKYFPEDATVEQKVIAISYASMSNKPIEEVKALDSFTFQGVKGNSDLVINKDDIEVFISFITDAKVFRLLSDSNIVPIITQE